MRRRAQSETHNRREGRARSLNSIRSFHPHETPKYFAVNPFQPLEQSGDDPVDEQTALYLCSIAGQSKKSDLRRGTDQMSASSSSLQAPQSPEASVLSSGLTQMDADSSVSGSSDAFILLQHQEALYRQLLFPEVDNWFTAVVEAAWDERDRLLLAAEEDVQRYWVMSDESNARDSLQVFKRNAEIENERRLMRADTMLSEMIARSAIAHEYYAEVSGLTSLQLAQFQRAVCRERDRLLEEEAALREASTTTHLPPICQPLHDTQVESSPRRREVCEGDINVFLFGDSEVLTIVPDAEILVRQHIVSSEEQLYRSLAHQYHRYVESTATLRRHSASKFLTLEEIELSERRVFEGAFFEMLMDAVGVIETLHRRVVANVQEPDVRKGLVSFEREEWLQARRIECARKHAESQVDDAELKEARVAMFRAQQEMARQRQSFERSECDARFDVARREARLFQLLLAEALEDRLAANAFQTRHDLRQVTVFWTPESYSAVCLAETSQRGALLRSETSERDVLRSLEVSSYIHSHRNMMINRDVAAQLQLV